MLNVCLALLAKLYDIQKLAATAPIRHYDLKTTGIVRVGLFSYFRRLLVLLAKLLN